MIYKLFYLGPYGGILRDSNFRILNSEFESHHSLCSTSPDADHLPYGFFNQLIEGYAQFY